MRQGDDVVAEPEEEAGVPGQRRPLADESSADLADADDVELDEADSMRPTLMTSRTTTT